MAYKVGQIRRNDISSSSSFASSIALQPLILSCVNNFGGNDFQDYCLLASEESFQKNKIYYIRFGIRKVFAGYYSQYYYNNGIYHDADILNITLLLKNREESDEQKYVPQQIGIFTVNNKPIIYNIEEFNDLNEEVEYQYFSFIFSPDKQYNTLVFRIQRNTYDALQNESIETSENEVYAGRRWLLNDGYETQGEERILKVVNDASVSTTCSVNSVFSSEAISSTCVQLHDIASEFNTPWLKMGYQCRPGSLIVVNGEPIRVGRSGIYEINNGTKINTIMIPTLSNTIEDAFLLDYAYEEKS